ncbi:MAG: epoxyqueuosine reductase QueH [Candidatus Omnitrophica bacterium]|nr:epoxyqueuosine reductase QueH [Candidatus Omnitrophota bacterium]
MSSKIKTILLHCCCAPCSGAIIDQLISEQITPTLFFYNPNVHPVDEYMRRKSSIEAYALKIDVPFFDADYDPDVWHKAVKGIEKEPERGKRCTACFDLRLEKTALFANKNGFASFATTNGIGRWKDIDQVNAAGLRAAQKYPGLSFLPRNWREGDALTKGARISRREGFYRQTYCGCIYSRNSINFNKQ